MKIGTTPVAAPQTRANNALGAGGELGKDAFIKLLLAQMRNQDPLNPTDSTAMIAQLAQFSSLEQMQNLNHKVEQLLGVQLLGELSSLVGKNITYQGDNEEVLQGRVQGLLWGGESSMLRVNDVLVPLGRLLEIKEGNQDA